jgi:hypothetical protein
MPLKPVSSGRRASRPPTSRKCWESPAPPCTAIFPMVCRSLRDSWCPPTPATIQRIDINGQPEAALSPDEGADGHTGKDMAAEPYCIRPRHPPQDGFEDHRRRSRSSAAAPRRSMSCQGSGMTGRTASGTSTSERGPSRSAVELGVNPLDRGEDVVMGDRLAVDQQCGHLADSGPQ